MTFKKSLLVVAVASALLSACSADKAAPKNSTPATTENVAIDKTATASEQANALFDTLFKEGVQRNPVRQTYLGIKTDYDKWQDFSEENAAKELAIAKANLKRVQSIDVNTLDAQTQISLSLFIQNLENHIADHKWRFHSYPVNQMYGTHSQIPAFLINQHSISNIKEAQDYIARVHGAQKLLEQLVVQLKLREDKGIIAPKFVFPHVIRDSKNILVGAPFEDADNSTILADFTRKVDKLSITDEEKSV